MLAWFPLETKGLISCMALFSFPLRKEWAFPDECWGWATLQAHIVGSCRSDGVNSTSALATCCLNISAGKEADLMD